MARFDVLANDVVIGRTDLEMGNLGKGIVVGSLDPTTEYVTWSGVEDAKLTIRLANEKGEFIDGFVTIEDFSAEVGGNFNVIEVTVSGLSEQILKRFFPALAALSARHSIG